MSAAQSAAKKAWWAAQPKQDPEIRRIKQNSRKRKEAAARVVRDPIHQAELKHSKYLKAKSRGYFVDWADRNRDSVREAFKKWKDNNPQAFKDAKRKCVLKKHFGLTVQQYADLLASQNSVCALCLKPERAKDYRTKTVKRLAIDHDHLTGKIRGLLCNRCNVGIGNLGDDPEVCLAAAAYIRKHRGI